MTVQMNWMGCFYMRFSLQRLVNRATIHGNNHINPIIFGVIFRDQAVIVRIERGVMEVVDGGVGEVQPHGVAADVIRKCLLK